MNESVVILFLAANPVGSPPLALDQEAKDIEAKINASAHRDSLTFKTRWAVTADDLIQALNQDRPRIVHFSGHGSRDGIVLMGEDREARVVSREALVPTFRAIKKDIRLAVLNACFTRPQAEAMIEVIDCVVGMDGAIGDEAARVFAASFYRALGFGESVRNAFEQGLAALMLQGIKEEHKPTLLARKGVDPDRVFILERAGHEGTAFSADQSRRLREALLQAYPTLDDLTMFASDRFGKNLEAITSTSTLEVAVFGLIRWAEARTRTCELVREAAADRPANPALQALVRELRL